MKHIFVETNWVVDYVMPAYRQELPAAELVQDAQAGKVMLHLPACCLAEARHPILTHNQPRVVTLFRQFLKWGAAIGRIDAADLASSRKTLEIFEKELKAHLNKVDSILQGISQIPGVEVFALNDRMLKRAADFSAKNLGLRQTFDLAILAAVLVRCEELKADGQHDLNFCEQDSDLQPWGKDNNSKQTLLALYNAAGVWVFRDFTLSDPPKPSNWPS